MRQYAGFGTRARRPTSASAICSAQGQTGLSVAFDLPTQMGYDSDHPRARGEVGKAGVAISCLADMEALLDEPPARPRDHLDDDQRHRPACCSRFYVAVADARGVPRAKLGGTVQNDVLKEYVARGTYIYPPEASLRLDHRRVRVRARARCRSGTRISVSGYHMREAGATAVQELAFTLGNGLAYLDAARARGLDRRARSRGGCRSSSTRTTICSRRWRSSAPRASCGPSCSASASASRDPEALQAALPHADRGLDADRAAAAEQRRARHACRRSPRCSAAPNRSTPTRTTRRSGFPARRRRCSRCARSRCWRTRAASPTRPIRSPARTWSSA